MTSRFDQEQFSWRIRLALRRLGKTKQFLAREMASNFTGPYRADPMNTGVYAYFDDSVPEMNSLLLMSQVLRCAPDFLLGLTPGYHSEIIKNAPEEVDPGLFSERFREMLVLRRVNCHRLGEMTGTSAASVYHWRDGKSLPRANRFHAVCYTFDCSASYLMGLIDSFEMLS